mgnify:FL=1|tara:strand:- start:271 stop:603 length:333 start_codon:yes stop_codon:yes gene_type:complete
MANTFKNAWKNEVNHSAADSVYTAPGATTSILIGLTLTNKGASDITATVSLRDNSVTTDIVFLNAVTIPKNTALEVMRGNKIVMETGDVVKIQCNTEDVLNAFLSVLEIS